MHKPWLIVQGAAATRESLTPPEPVFNPARIAPACSRRVQDSAEQLALAALLEALLEARPQARAQTACLS